MTLKDRIVENWNLNTISPVYFWKSEWEKFDPDDKLQNPSVGYLIFRGAVMCYFIGACSTAMACSDMNYYFIFLTNFTISLQLIYSALYFFRLLWVMIERREIETRLFPSNTQQQIFLPWPEKVIYILASITFVIPYAVTFGYWVFLYDSSNRDQYTTCNNISNFLVHAFNSVFAFGDVWIVAIPFRISSVIFPITYGFLYALFSALYEVFGGTYVGDLGFIYPFLNWKKTPGYAALAVLVGLFIVTSIHFVMVWGVSRLRVMAYNNWCSKTT